MKLNNKGFMLAELVIVAASVMVSLTAVYLTFSKIYTGFNRNNNYDSVDAMYASRGMYDIIINDGGINSCIQNFNNNLCDLKGIEVDGQGKKFIDEYGIINSYLISKNNISDVSNVIDSITSPYLKDYISYLNENIDVNDNSFNYVLVTELSDKATETETKTEDGANLAFGYYLVP